MRKERKALKASVLSQNNGQLPWLPKNPQNGQNPYKMFEGIVVPAGKDEEGNIIYKYNGKD